MTSKYTFGKKPRKVKTRNKHFGKKPQKWMDDDDVMLEILS